MTSGAVQALEPYGYFWLRYTYENLTGEAEEHPNYFSVERGYFRLEQKVSDELTVKATVDMAMKQGATQATDWQIRLKDAAAEWKPPYISEYIPDAKLILGLQKTYFGYIDIWEYPLIEKALEDVEKKMNSRELGLGFTANLPKGYGDLALGVFNGTGYSHPVETNENKALLTNISLIPIPGLMLRGSYWMAKQPITRDETVVDVDQNRLSGVVQVRFGPLTLVGEYLASKDEDVDGAGFMGFAQFQALPKLSLAARFDQWDPNTDKEKDSHQRIIGGVNYELADGLLCQLEYNRKEYEDPDKEAADMARLQFKYSY
jgi:hypothetical protein